MKNSRVILFTLVPLLVMGVWGARLYSRLQGYEKGAVEGTQVGQDDGVDYETIKPISSDDLVVGDPKSQLLLIEYSDLECPYCQRFHQTIQELREEYPDLTWVFRHYPLSIHAHALDKAKAVVCAQKLLGGEAAWQLIDSLFEGGSEMSMDEVDKKIVAMGVDQSGWQACINDAETKTLITAQQKGGQKVGVNGTPGSFVINTKTKQVEFIPGALPMTTLKQVVESVQ